MKDTRNKKREQQSARQEMKWHEAMVNNYRRLARFRGQDFPHSEDFFTDLQEVHVKASRTIQRKLDATTSKKKFTKKRF